jgi:prepilin-type processing-associated H-X9-DG protein
MTAMNDNLLGYVLDALDPDERDAVERALEHDAGLRHQLELLRQALTPLALDAEPPPVPDRLAERTLALIARHQGSTSAGETTSPSRVPARPRPAPVWKPSFTTGGWRRVDFAAAAALLLAAISLALPARNAFLARSAVVGCQNNLRQYHQALSQYSDMHHDDFPIAQADHPRHNFAGVFVPALGQEQLIDPRHRLDCGSPAEAGIPSLSEFESMSPTEFETWIERAAGRYAYTLGYRQDGVVRPLHRDDSSLDLPIMADRPPVAGSGNSPNHGGSGQNVLFIDGHVRFVPNRSVGPEGDDIYTNQHDEVGAGLHPRDTVLGESKARP